MTNIRVRVSEKLIIGILLLKIFLSEQNIIFFYILHELCDERFINTSEFKLYSLFSIENSLIKDLKALSIDLRKKAL